jgi:diguanylate cyclase (GGDEF)-like protein
VTDAALSDRSSAPARGASLLRSSARRIALVCGAVAAVEVAWWVVTRDDVQLLAASLAAALGAWLYLVSLHTRDGEERRGALLMGAGMLLALSLALPIVPDSRTVIALATVVPVVLAAPYLGARALTWASVAAVVVGVTYALAGDVLVVRGTVGPVRLDASGLVGDAVGTAAVLAVILLLLARYHGAIRRLRYMTLHDELTGLGNRGLFTDRLAHALARGDDRGPITAVLHLDIDAFHETNDRHGHGFGDEVLKAVAARLRDEVRPADTVARMGSDGFAVLLEDLSGRAEAIASAERLVGSVERTLSVRGEPHEITCSAGLALSAEGDATAAVLLQDADLALEQAKREPGRSLVVYEPALRAGTEEARRMRQAIRGVVERAELRLQYQPIVRLHSGYDDSPGEHAAAGTLAAVEALVRWDQPARGTRSPGEFIALAEETGAILPLGRWVLRTACRQLGEWQRRGARDLRVMVNVSAVELEQVGFEAAVVEALADAGISPRSLGLEITEHVMVRDDPSVHELLRRLRARGVHVVIDDFGTGYSSLSYLRSLPVDALKMDGSFLPDALGSSTATALLRAMVDLGAALGATTVAEGVETRGQLLLLRSLGCDLGQGYLLSRPMDASDLESSLRTGRWPWHEVLGMPATVGPRERSPGPGLVTVSAPA